MSLGTASVVQSAGQDGSTVFHDKLSFVGDDSYPTDGTAAFEAYVQAALSLGSRDVVAVVSEDCGDHYAVYDQANDKLKVFLRSTGAEVANAVDLSSVTFNVLVLSR